MLRTLHNYFHSNTAKFSAKMFSSNVIAVVALALFGLASAQVVSDGPCPSNIEVVPDFDVEKYMGTWYEYAKYPVIFEFAGKCVTAEYALQADGDVSVTNSMINKFTDKPSEIEGVAKYVSNAKLNVIFPVSPPYNVSSNYWVLGTDYSTYSVVYSCLPLGDNNKHSTTVWILTRTRDATLQVALTAERVLEKNDISLKELVKTNQSDCN